MIKVELHIEKPEVANDAFMDAYNALLDARAKCANGNYTLIPEGLYLKLKEKYGNPSKDWEEYVDAQLFILAGICQQMENQINESNQSN
ncbi:MAG: hypothetical protein IKR19_08965 [Acholeplasmatales bacterium]|nr:hypothetical protein [Acholeplasmatales bacterium]